MITRRQAAFTLLEICLAVAIALMLLTIAVPSIKAVLEGNRLQRSFDSFDALVAQAQFRSKEERRPYALIWDKQEIALQPMEIRDGENGRPIQTFSFGKDETYLIERPAAMGPKPAPVWTFWRSGVCEPAIITYQGPEGTWKASYDALTARRTMLDEQVRR